jgi:hypothetical protein
MEFARKILYGRMMKGIYMKKFCSVISLSFLVILLFVVSLPSICFSEMKTVKITDDGWVFYGKSVLGNHFYDKNSIEHITPSVFKVSEKLKYSKDRKDKIIKLKNDYKQPMDGWEKLDHEINVYSIDCSDKTVYWIAFRVCDDKGNILDKFVFPYPSLPPLSPPTMKMNKLLHKEVCK